MDIREEVPSKKPVIPRLKPSTKALYEKFKKKKRVQKVQKQRLKSGESSQQSPAMQEEEKQDPTPTPDVPTVEKPAEREAIPTPTEPFSTSSTAGDPESGTSHTAHIPPDLLDEVMKIMKPGDSVLDLIEEVKAKRAGKPFKPTPSFDFGPDYVEPQTETMSQNPPPPSQTTPTPEMSTDPDSPPIDPQTGIPSPQPLNFYIPPPTDLGGSKEDEGMPETPTGAREEGEESESAGVGRTPETGEGRREDVNLGVEQSARDVDVSAEDSDLEAEADKAKAELDKQGDAPEQKQTEVKQGAKASKAKAKKKKSTETPPKAAPAGASKQDAMEIESGEESPKRPRQATRKRRTSERLKEIVTEKSQRAKGLEQPKRKGPLIKMAHTSPEIEQFEKDKNAESESAREEEESTAKPTKEQSEAEEAEKQRKRKGKQVAASQSKRARSTKEGNRGKPVQVPFEGKEHDADYEEGSEEETSQDSEDDHSYPTLELTVDVYTAEQMKLFKTAGLQEKFERKEKEYKLVKAGRKYHKESLRKVGVLKGFHESLEAIGFEQLLSLEEEKVPFALALEFFTTFRFKVTPDVKKESISFRTFNVEWRMSLEEWTCRMGLLDEEEAETAWTERHIGRPSTNKEFIPQKAWKELTTGDSGEFKASQSKGLYLADPPLRFAQVYLGYNLLGQTSPTSTITLSELYLTWCMKRRIKVHLGYWMAYGLNAIANHPSRHMNSCHLLGTFQFLNMIIKYTKEATPTRFCPEPTLFDLSMFVNTSLVEKVGEELQLYEPGVLIPTAGGVKREEAEVAKADRDDWKKEMLNALVTLVQENKSMKEAFVEQQQQLAQAVTSMKELADKVLNKSAEASGSGKASAGSGHLPDSGKKQ